MTSGQHTQTLQDSRLKEHADNRDSGINHELCGVTVGLCSRRPMLTNTIPHRRRMSKNKAAVRGLEGLGRRD